MKNQRGFTLIELVVVIIILGVLAAVAVPRFVNMSVDARNAAARGVAGAIASGSSINYAARQAGNGAATVLDQANVCTADLLSDFVQGVELVAANPEGDNQFLVGGTGNCSTSANNPSVICNVRAAGTDTGILPQDVTVFCAR